MIYDKKFEKEKKLIINSFKKNKEIKKAAYNFCLAAAKYKYTYNFSWFGVPIIQHPEDLIIMQEIILEVKPDLIIDIGVARGGSSIYYSSILELLGNKGKVLGVDIDYRKHTKKVFKKHYLKKNVKLIEGSSISSKVANRIYNFAKNYKKIMVCLDSNHTHDHVLEELNLYSKIVSKNSYLVVFDTTDGLYSAEIIKKISKKYKFKPFSKKSNPLTAVKEFIKKNKNFKIDESKHTKAQITSCYKGFLKKIKN